MASDPIFLHLIRLLSVAKSSGETRKRVIKAFHMPLSEAALAFIGKRLRDESEDVCITIFKHLKQLDCRLETFKSP